MIKILKDKLLKKAKLSDYFKADVAFQRSISRKSLVLMGIGGVIGSGIFILPGIVAAKHAGPAIIVSFVIAAIVCALATMCYAEFASALPVSGTAYSYGNIIFGQFAGWIIGWALVLEYMLGVATVSSGFSAYFKLLLDNFNIHMSAALTGPFNPAQGTYINLPAIIIVLLIYFMLLLGTKQSTALNNFIVIVKITIIVVFIVVGFFKINPANWHPFMPFGVGGVIKGAYLVFFAYMGFDIIAAAAPEVKDPERNIPFGVIATTSICAILYILVALVLTGMVYYKHLDVNAPVPYALSQVGLKFMIPFINIGALAGMISMMMATMYGGSRLIFSLGRDSLLPHALSKVNPKDHLPVLSLTIITIIIVILGGFVPLDQLTNIVNIGTLISLVFISFGIIPLRHRKDIKNEGYQVPFYPYLPILSGILCITLMLNVNPIAWIAAGIWFVIGIIIYFTYGIKHSY